MSVPTPYSWGGQGFAHWPPRGCSGPNPAPSESSIFDNLVAFTASPFPTSYPTKNKQLTNTTATKTPHIPTKGYAVVPVKQPLNLLALLSSHHLLVPTTPFPISGRKSKSLAFFPFSGHPFPPPCALSLRLGSLRQAEAMMPLLCQTGERACLLWRCLGQGPGKPFPLAPTGPWHWASAALRGRGGDAG